MTTKSTETLESERAETCPGNCEKLPETSPRLLDNSDNKPVVTIQFLGLKDGRQKLAVVAEKLARKHASKVCMEGCAESNFVNRNVGEILKSSENLERGGKSSTSGSENSTNGLRKRNVCRAESSEGSQSPDNPSLYKFKAPGNLATSDESSEMELDQQNKCSLESSEKIGKKI